jgi:hypothetical protein
MWHSGSHHRNLTHALASLLTGLSERIGHILGTPNADANGTAVISHHHHRAETKSAAALNHFRDPVNIHHALIHFISVVIAMTTRPTSSHHVALLEF